LVFGNEEGNRPEDFKKNHKKNLSVKNEMTPDFFTKVFRNALKKYPTINEYKKKKAVKNMSKDKIRTMLKKSKKLRSNMSVTKMISLTW
jgi:hypothetical protein